MLVGGGVARNKLAYSIPVPNNGLSDTKTNWMANEEFKLVMVSGYTDRISSEAYNQKLSERRANEVKAYIVSQGIDASRLQAVGKGESEPVVDCKGVKGKKLIECLAPNPRIVSCNKNSIKLKVRLLVIKFSVFLNTLF